MPPPERHPGARATPATGAGAAAAATLGRRASAPFPVPPPPPKWAPPPAHRAVPKTAAAALDLELARVRSLSKLRKRLEASCGRGGLSLNGSGLLTFERYLWAARAETGVVAARVRPPRGHEDAVLPPTARAGVAALAADLCRRGADKEQAQTAAADLGAAAAAAATKLAARARALSTGATPLPLTVAATPSRHSVELTAHGADGKQAAFARLSRSAYRALVARYRRDVPPGDPPLAGDAAADADDTTITDASSTRTPFHTRLLTLLLRYRSVGGAGFHAAVGAPVVAALSDTLSTGLECFASTLNAASARFGTAFPDVDAPFGGVGDFFGGGCLPAGAAVTANPPFEPTTLARAATAALAALTAADAAGTRLTIAFVCPAWRDGEAWRLLTVDGASHAATPHPIVIAAADHGFRDGAPHGGDRDPHRASPYDTALFVLVSRAQAAKRALDAGALEARLRGAFAACVPSAAAAGRQAARRGGKDVKAWSGGKRRVEGGGKVVKKKKKVAVKTAVQSKEV